MRELQFLLLKYKLCRNGSTQVIRIIIALIIIINYIPIKQCFKGFSILQPINTHFISCGSSTGFTMNGVQLLQTTKISQHGKKWLHDILNVQPLMRKLNIFVGYVPCYKVSHSIDKSVSKSQVFQISICAVPCKSWY